MKIKKIKRVGTGILSAALFCGLAWSAENTMPLTMEGGTARAMSMGSAVVGAPQESASLFWNPAGLGLMKNGLELGLHHNSGLGESIHETVVLGMPMGSLGGFAVSLNYVDNGAFEGRDTLGVQTADYTAGDLGVSLGWGKELFSGISAGVALKYNLQTLAAQSYSAYAMDLGLLWNPISGLNLGLTYSNLGNEIAGSFLSSGWRAGASYNINKDVLLAVSGGLTGGTDRSIQAGAETYIFSCLALRAGYVINATGLEGLTGLTAGLGVKIDKSLTFDYGYIPYGELGESHRLSLTYKFEPLENIVSVK